MEKHIETYFFNSNQLPKLVKFNLEMERLRKKRVFAKDFQNISEDLEEEENNKSSEIKRLLNHKINPLLLVEPQQEVIDDVVEESNFALTDIEEYEPEEIDNVTEESITNLTDTEESNPNEIDNVTEESNSALTDIEESEPEEISEDKLLLSQDLEKAPDVLAKSQENKKEKLEKELTEREQMQQFLEDFIETVKEEKEKMAI